MKKCYKHNIVKTNLHPCGWIDTDVRMLYAIMTLVSDFVNKELPKFKLSKKDYLKELARIKKSKCHVKEQLKHMKIQYESQEKIISIAKWWKNYDNRNKEIDRARKAWTNYYEQFIEDKEEFLGFQKARDAMNAKEKEKEDSLLMNIHALETKLYNEEQEILKLAVELRSAMWT